ncbi:MAG: Na/Pi cotransporter family protein [Novosphingobium sp.]|nr:Na/Pi cotransporter family protein [Novosphingobium sp.]MCP5380404.1 Na/Pi cotransporter family protein [Novosphingobium sp.]MCP5389749.1 Na/Pi cotransporter family protein [Novosphingobium sp.]
MAIAEIILTFLAGFGLLQVGIRMIGRNLSAMTGNRLRTGISRASRTAPLGALFGTLAGFITQSTRTICFVSASFVQAGMLEVRNALPIVIWANLGSVIVIFAAVFPFHLAVLFLLATAAIPVAFERPKAILKGASAAFGLALILFGLRMMSTSARKLAETDLLAGPLLLLQNSLTLCFCFGLALTCLTQSQLAAMLIILASAQSGIFGVEQALLLMIGAQAGHSLLTYATGMQFRGQSRQVVLGEVMFNVPAVLIFLVPFMLDQALTGGQGQQWIYERLGLPAGTYAAVMVLAVNFLAPLLLTLLLAPYHALCVRLAPPRGDETLSRPRYLRHEVEESAVATLMLAEKEQLRLLRRLPVYCDALRDLPANRDEASPADHYAAFAMVAGAIDQAHARLVAQVMTTADTEWLLNQQKRQELLGGIHEACHDLYTVASNIGSAIRPLRATIVETLDTLLLTTIEGMANRDVHELSLVERMTSSQGTTMERIRKKYLSMSHELSDEDRARILKITSIFERAAWSIRTFALALSASSEMASAPDLAEADNAGQPVPAIGA